MIAGMKLAEQEQIDGAAVKPAPSIIAKETEADSNNDNGRPTKVQVPSAGVVTPNAETNGRPTRGGDNGPKRALFRSAR